MIDQYGADAVRLFTMFAAPPEQSLEWSDAGLEGSQRFIKRFWKQVHQHLSGPAAPALKASELNQQQQDMRRKTHETIQKSVTILNAAPPLTRPLQPLWN